MLGQPLDVSISETQVIEEDCSNPSFAEDIPHTLDFSGMNCDDAESEMAPVAPTRIGRGSQPALIGAGAMIVIVLLGFHVATGRRAPWAQNPSRLFALVDSGVQMEIGADRNPPAVILAPTFTDEPARRLVSSQLGALNEAYARWSEADPATRGTVALKLSVEPSGKILRVDEVISRLSEHRFLDVVLTEAKMWKLPHRGGQTAEISIPLMFVPGRLLPVNLAAKRKSPEPAAVVENQPATHTSDALEDAEPPARLPDTVAASEIALKPHTHGRLEQASDTEVTALPIESSHSLGNAMAKQEPAATANIPESETEIARTAALKHEPRFAADAIEKVRLGTRVKVLRKERDWIKVKVQTSGNVGYLRKEYLAAFNTLR